MVCQFRTRLIQNHFRSIHTETLLYDWYGNEIKMMTKGLVHLEEESVALVQKLGYAILIYQFLNALCQFPDFVIGTPKLILSGDQWSKQPLFISQQHDLTLRFPIRRMNGDC